MPAGTVRSLTLHGDHPGVRILLHELRTTVRYMPFESIVHARPPTLRRLLSEAIAVSDTTKVAAGLFGAWVVHDAEEMLTMSENSRWILKEIPRWLPIPEELRMGGVSQAHVNMSLMLMAGLMGTASLLGVRSSGRSAFFRGALLAFGAHGFSHIGASVVTGRYTTGVVTAPVVVIPYWLWARGVLREHGIADQDGPARVMAALNLPLLFGVHALSHRILTVRAGR